MIFTTLLLATTAHASTYATSNLYSSLQTVVGVSIADFLPSNQLSVPKVHIARLLMSSGEFVPQGSPDPIEVLMTQLATGDRKVAVQHFIKHNAAELIGLTDKLAKSVGVMDLLVFQLRSNPPPSALRELANLLFASVSTYVYDRDGRCMYDYVPMRFRDPSNYDKLFIDLSGGIWDSMWTNYRSSDMDGIFMYVDTDAFFGNISTTVYRDPYTGVLRLNTDHLSTLVNLKGQCAAELHPNYRTFSFYPGKRALMGADRELNTALIWREDSLTPVSISFSENSRLDFLASQDAFYFAYQAPLPDQFMTSHNPSFSAVGWRSDLQRSFLGCVVGASTPTGTFKVSSRLADLPTVQSLSYTKSTESCSSYTSTVDSHYSGAYHWEILDQISTGRQGEVAIFLPSTSTFFRWLKNAWECVVRYGDAWANSGHYPVNTSTQRVLRYMTGLETAEPVPIMTETQRLLTEVIKNAKQDRLYDAWRLVAESGLSRQPGLTDIFLLRSVAIGALDVQGH